MNITYVCYGSKNDFNLYGCHANLFYSSYKPPQVLEFQYCITKEKEFRPKANWFFREVVLKSIPERIYEAIKFTRIYTKNTRKEIYDFYGNNIFPWLKMEIDTQKICTDDLYILLTLMRISQEQPNCVREVYRLFHEKEYPIDVAHFIGTSCHHQTEHYFNGYYYWNNFFKFDPHKVKTWKFKDIWENIRTEQKPSFFKSNIKTIDILRGTFFLPYIAQTREFQDMGGSLIEAFCKLYEEVK